MTCCFPGLQILTRAAHFPQASEYTPFLQKSRHATLHPHNAAAAVCTPWQYKFRLSFFLIFSTFKPASLSFHPKTNKTEKMK